MAKILSNQCEYIASDTSNIYNEKWKSWCRLCAKADERCVNVISGIHSHSQPSNETSFSQDINLSYLIAKYFQIEIQEDEKLSQVICLECCKYITALNKFGERVNNVQQMYDELYKCKDKTRLNMGFLLEKYGIFNDESILAHDENELPVEKIFIAVLEQVDRTSQADNKEDAEFHDPIGDETRHSEKAYCTTTDSEGSSSGEDNYSEDDADSTKHNKNRLKKTSEDTEEQTCNICSQIFQRRSNYSTHMKRKHGVIVCPQCPGSFKNISSLNKHMVEHRKSFNCTQCEQKFERKGLLGKHMRNDHKAGGKFICEACGEAMTTKKQLTLHMLTHSDYTPYKCKDCGRCFKEKYLLKRHSEIHGDKVICPVCGKQLSCRATFNNHMLVHSDNAPYKCDVCGRAFKRGKALKYHLLAHTGLRPYSCDFCDKTFSTGSSCRFHKKTMHPVELAALEASGAKAYTKNVPNLDSLRAVAKTGRNFLPLASKQNGYTILRNSKDASCEDGKDGDDNNIVDK
ncbi:unnamed protein product [Ceratitis capitata]|uniref:(Mediterranean fruit fly) hypothetical protein n=1 Tax=Ceratitis capitata TaxID=7213 RepID=A0A811UC09_CERCA|nr:unnamed protein product [Ceratitis capitata]